MIISAIGNYEDLVPIQLGSCALEPQGGGCGRYSENNCPAEVPQDVAIKHMGENYRLLLQEGLIEKVTIYRKTPMVGSTSVFYCYYDFVLTAEAQKFVRTRGQWDPYGRPPSGSVVGYNKKFLQITGIRDIDDGTKAIEYLVKYDPTVFANTIAPTSLHRRRSDSYPEQAVFTRYDDGWRLTKLGR